MHALARLGEPVRCFASRARPRPAPAAMGSSSAGRDPSANPTVSRLRELFQRGDAAAIRKYWNRWGFKAVLMEDNEGSGREKLGRRKRCRQQSSLREEMQRPSSF